VAMNDPIFNLTIFIKLSRQWHLANQNSSGKIAGKQNIWGIKITINLQRKVYFILAL
jgi:hypothetical protein